MDLSVLAVVGLHHLVERDAATLAGPAFSGATVAVDLAMDAQLVGRGAENGSSGGDSPPGGVGHSGGLCG